MICNLLGVYWSQCNLLFIEKNKESINLTIVLEYYHVDHLESTLLKTDSGEDMVYESNYEPFGLDVDESGSANSIFQ